MLCVCSRSVVLRVSLLCFRRSLQDAGNPFMNQLNIDEWTEEFLAELEKKVE